jgi:hypothetical protein
MTPTRSATPGSIATLPACLRHAIEAERTPAVALVMLSKVEDTQWTLRRGSDEPCSRAHRRGSAAACRQTSAANDDAVCAFDHRGVRSYSMRYLRITSCRRRSETRFKDCELRSIPLYARRLSVPAISFGLGFVASTNGEAPVSFPPREALGPDIASPSSSLSIAAKLGLERQRLAEAADLSSWCT